VTLSVLAVLGIGAFMVGIRRESQDARFGELALLGLATAKVFLFDLASLDVAYRVISFVALGLVGAWLSQRQQRRAPAPDDPAPPPPTTSSAAP
jgi:uncharacterized membrane protein